MQTFFKTLQLMPTYAAATSKHRIRARCPVPIRAQQYEQHTQHRMRAHTLRLAAASPPIVRCVSTPKKTPIRAQHYEQHTQHRMRAHTPRLATASPPIVRCVSTPKKRRYPRSFTINTHSIACVHIHPLSSSIYAQSDARLTGYIVGPLRLFHPWFALNRR